jgi:hypothetical protein
MPRPAEENIKPVVANNGYNRTKMARFQVQHSTEFAAFSMPWVVGAGVVVIRTRVGLIRSYLIGSHDGVQVHAEFLPVGVDSAGRSPVERKIGR